DADIILLMYREDYYEKETTRKNHVDINIAKNRSGTVGDFELLFNRNVSTFSNLLPESSEDYLGERQSMDEY
ncbi:MAG: hypothetical protein JXB20_03350, partial [Bacilli bacterium]|nr:hypothetical protein [Bacilli bacterium]